VPIDNQRNQQSRDALIEVLRTGRALGITGAGLSNWAGYVTWPVLIERLATAVRENRRGEVNVDVVLQNGRNPLFSAQRLGQFLGTREFRNFIRTEFGPLQSAPHEVLYRFASLPFRHILTFNFEESLERVHNDVGTACGSISSSDRHDMAFFVREMDAHNYTRHIVHLHGKGTDSIDRIALTEEGYATLYDDNFFRNLLWLFATSQRLVFVGFGFKDNDFVQTWRVNVRHVRDNGLCHFAIVGLRPDENDQQRRTDFNDVYLIDPIFYPIRSNEGRDDHGAFLELINGLVDAVGRRIQPTVPAIAPVVPDIIPPDADDLRQAENLANRIIERADPGGGDV
jgi:hypothetical protein